MNIVMKNLKEECVYASKYIENLMLNYIDVVCWFYSLQASVAASSSPSDPVSYYKETVSM